MKIRLLKHMDKTLGAFLTRLLKTPRKRPGKSPKRILIIRPGGIGDAVQIVPMVDCLYKAFPEASIDILAEKRNAAVFELTPDLAGVYRYDRLPDLLRVIGTKYDVVIDSEQWHYLSAVVARLMGSARCVGYATNERGQLFTDIVPYSHDDYEAESFFHLLTPLGNDKLGQAHAPYLLPPAAARTEAVTLLGEFAAVPFIAVFPGASIPERRWGWERFSEVVLRLNSREIPVVVVGGKEDFSDGEKIIADKRGLNLAGKTLLAETAAVIARSALLVSSDSGILHIGVGLGKPTVSLFGPGIAKKWAPRGERHVVINKNLPCSPCTKFGYTPRCRIDARCMAEISVDEVMAAILVLLEKHGKDS